MADLQTNNQEGPFASQKNINLKFSKIIKMIAIIIFTLCASVLIGLWTRVHQVEVENTELLEKYKGEHRDEYFVNIDGEEIHVEKHVWYLVEANETYNIEYKWSHYHGAELIHIEKSD